MPLETWYSEKKILENLLPASHKRKNRHPYFTLFSFFFFYTETRWDLIRDHLDNNKTTYRAYIPISTSISEGNPIVKKIFSQWNCAGRLLFAVPSGMKGIFYSRVWWQCIRWSVEACCWPPSSQSCQVSRSCAISRSQSLWTPPPW